MTLQVGSSSYLFVSDRFEAEETQYGPTSPYPVRGIKLGTIDYATNQANRVNVLDMQFTVSRPDIAALKF